MANSIPFIPPHQNSRESLYQELQRAPIEHSEALLDAYEILQLLRDKGILEIVKGGLKSGEKLLEIVTQIIETQGAVNFFRNLTILIKMVGGLNPETLETLENSLAGNLANAETQDPPGLFSLLIKLASQDNRRILSMITSVSESLGKQLSHQRKNNPTENKERQVVTRRKVSLVRIDPRAP